MSEETEVLDRGDDLPQNNEDVVEDKVEDTSAETDVVENEEAETTTEPTPAEAEGSAIDDLQRQLQALQEQNQYLLYMQQQAQQAAQQEQKANEPDLEESLSKLEDDYTDALMDGDTDKAKKIYRDIRKTEREILKQEVSVSKEEMTNVSERTVQKRDLDVVVGELEKSHPELNPRSKKYDANLVTAINGVFGSFIEQGVHKNPVEAMNAAVSMFSNKLEVKKAEQPKPKQSLRSKIDTQKQQPASKPGKTSSTTPAAADVTVSDLSDDKLFSLSNEQLAILRGDIIQQ